MPNAEQATSMCAHTAECAWRNGESGGKTGR
jgi:hypothetical protein